MVVPKTNPRVLWTDVGLAVGVVGLVLGCAKPEPEVPRGATTTGPQQAQNKIEGSRTESSDADNVQEGTGAESGFERLSAQSQENYTAAIAAFQSGNLKAALDQFHGLLRADPGVIQAYVALGNVQERSGDPSGAMASYSAALSKVAGYGPAVLAKTKLYLATDREKSAENFARSLLAQHPDNAAVLAALAEVRSIRGDSTSAQRLAQQALKRDPDFRPAMVTIARDHYRSRRLDLALYTLTAILDGYGPENPPRDRSNAEARLLRAHIFKEQRKRNKAMEEFKRVVKLRPDWVEARLHLAAYMLEAGNATDARPLLEAALQYEPSNLIVHVNLGDAYRLLGKPKDALQHLRWVSRKDPELASTYYNLGLVFLFSPEVPGLTEAEAIVEAIGAFEKFKKLEPRAARGEGDDVNELLARAKNRKSILEALSEDSSDDMSEDEEWDD